MIFKKVYFYVVTVALLLALIISGATILHSEWRTAYTILFQKSYYKVNLIDLKLKNLFDGIYRPLVASHEKGLPEKRIYISQKSRNTLLEDLPENIREWQKAFLLYPDGKLRRVKVRHRGDNPMNWAYNKKSWRVKLSKKSLINRRRTFDYIVPQEENQFNTYFTYYVGRLTGVLSPRVRLVELFINDVSQGIYLEREHIDESFLRNNGLMPVNVYKGEQVGRERQVTISNNLFDNPGLWSKTSVFNQKPEDDFSDLRYALELIRSAETSDISFDRLKNLANYEDWARFSALQTLIQSWHANTIEANTRLVSDQWKGTIRPIIIDGGDLGQNYKDKSTFDIVLDAGYPHPILFTYMMSSDFLIEKYKKLYGFVEAGLITKVADELEALLPAMQRSFSRDYFRYEKVYINEHLASPANLKHSLMVTTDEGMWAEWNKMIGVLRWYQSALREKLEMTPPVHWRKGDGFISLVVDGALPVEQIALELSSGQQIPRVIAWDVDGDGHLSKNDRVIPFRVNGNLIQLSATWVANRVVKNSEISNPKSSISKILQGGEYLTVPTGFRIVADVSLDPVSMRAVSSLTDEVFVVGLGSEAGNTPSHRNIPVIEKQQDPVEVWQQQLIIEGNRIVDRPVKILPGTNIRMLPGASLVFRNRVQVEGTVDAPVTIKSDVQGEPWGTVAFHGPNTEESVISHMILENGSGAFVENVRYIGMLSIHEATNIEFRNLTLRNNAIFDDMMHVVYSNDIRLQNCFFDSAFSDSLDVDISTISIQGCKITGSGNDAIDLMGAKARIIDSELSHSGDKGVSVGEGSEVMIYNSHIRRNLIGVESKDGSTAYIINSNLMNNNRQINAYKKNWRYGAGGSVVVDKAMFSASENSIKGDKHSNIDIFDSTFSPGFGKKDKQVMLDDSSDDFGDKKSANMKYKSATSEVLRQWDIKGNPDQRGVVR